LKSKQTKSGGSGDGELDAILQRFFARTAAGIVPGLDAIKRRLEKLDHPERAFKVVHVAGTNGKGSTAATIERLLREAGLRTGLFTSPHLVRFNERIRIDGEEIDDEQLAKLAFELEQIDADCAGRPATFFELATAIGYTAFARADVDVAIIETGLGGRWDATNVIVPEVSVITRIGMDHTGFLGDTLTQIASEKAGIIKQGVPVVCSVQEPEALMVIEAVAASRFCELHLSGPDDLDQLPAEAAESWPLRGAHQRENLASAVVATKVLLERLELELSSEQWQSGLAGVQWPARFQTLHDEPLVVLDAAHNPNGARALRRTLDALHPDTPIAWVMAFMGDKDCSGMLKALGDRLFPKDHKQSAIWLVPLEMRRAANAETLKNLVPVAIVAPLEEAVADASAWALEHQGMVCIAGSLYLAGEVLKLGPGAYGKRLP